MAEEVTPITITVESAVVEAALDRLARAARDLRPVMRDIGGLLEKETDDNFRAQGRPHWLAILQDTGVLRGSIRVYSDKSSVTIGAARVMTKAGSPLEYAAIHQFGGMAGRNRKVRIPARPFLPVDRDGNLSPEAERGVLAAIYDHLAESV